MKKLLLVLSMLFTLAASAHTYNPLGYCTDRKEAVFQTLYFGRFDSVEVQYKVYNTNTWLQLPNGLFVTNSNANTGIVIGVPQPSVNEPVTIRYRWKTRNSNGSYGSWSSWSTATAKKTTFNSCGNVVSLPVKFSDLSVSQIDPETLLVRFTTFETEGVKQFNVQFSLDGKTFKTVAIIFPDGANPNTSYKAKIKISSLK
jgi:hypothetical protein